MSDDQGEEKEDVFEVEKIVGIRYDKEDQSRKLYRVRWKGCPPEEDTWEPKENLYSCDDLLRAFKKEHKDKKMRKKLNKEAARNALAADNKTKPSASNKPTIQSVKQVSTGNMPITETKDKTKTEIKAKLPTEVQIMTSEGNNIAKKDIKSKPSVNDNKSSNSNKTKVGGNNKKKDVLKTKGNKKEKKGGGDKKDEEDRGKKNDEQGGGKKKEDEFGGKKKEEEGTRELTSPYSDISDASDINNEYCQTRRQRIELEKVLEISRKEAEGGTNKETDLSKTKSKISKPNFTNKRKIDSNLTADDSPIVKKQAMANNTEETSPSALKKPSEIINEIFDKSNITTPTKTLNLTTPNKKSKIVSSLVTPKSDSDYVPLFAQLQQVEVIPMTPDRPPSITPVPKINATEPQESNDLKSKQRRESQSNEADNTVKDNNLIAKSELILPLNNNDTQSVKKIASLPKLNSKFAKSFKNLQDLVRSKNNSSKSLPKTPISAKQIPLSETKPVEHLNKTINTSVTAPVNQSTTVVSSSISTASVSSCDSSSTDISNNDAILNSVLSEIIIEPKSKKTANLLKLKPAFLNKSRSQVEKTSEQVSIESNIEAKFVSDASESRSECSSVGEPDELVKHQETKHSVEIKPAEKPSVDKFQNENSKRSVTKNNIPVQSTLNIPDKNTSTPDKNSLTPQPVKKKILGKSLSIGSTKPSRSDKLLDSMNQPLSKPSKVVDKSKKISLQEYKSKKNRKSLDTNELQVPLLGFTRITKDTTGNAQISGGSSDDNITVLKPKQSVEVFKPKANKPKEKILKVSQIATETDVLGNILQQCQSPKESNSNFNFPSTEKDDSSKSGSLTGNEAALDEDIELTNEDDSDSVLLEQPTDTEEEYEEDESDLEEYIPDPDEFSLEVSVKEIPHTSIPGANSKKVQNFIVHQSILREDKQTLIQCSIDHDQVNTYVDGEHTLLMKAVLDCSPNVAHEFVKILIEKKADPNKVSKDGRTPLMVAVEKNQLKLVKLLIRHNAHLNIQTSSGETALIMACRNGYIEIIHVLLNSGADVKPALANLDKFCESLSEDIKIFLRNTLNMHASKLRMLTENVLKDLMITSFDMQLGDPLMTCRCISPNESIDHDFYFPCPTNATEYNTNILLLALPVLFERNGRLKTKLDLKEKEGVQRIILNEVDMLSITPAGHFLYYITPLINELNNVKIITTNTEDQCKILICVYNITLRKFTQT